MWIPASGQSSTTILELTYPKLTGGLCCTQHPGKRCVAVGCLHATTLESGFLWEPAGTGSIQLLAGALKDEWLVANLLKDRDYCEDVASPGTKGRFASLGE